MKSKNPVESLIVDLRGQKVILDADLAELYGVATKVFNQAVKRNEDRFPVDFCFQLTTKEWTDLKSQIVISSSDVSEKQVPQPRALRSQIVTLKKGRGEHRKYLPYAFTEHGAIMAATVLNSPAAVAMSVYVVRAFIQMREQIAANAHILKRLAQIDDKLLEHDEALGILWHKLKPLLTPPPPPPPLSRKRIGFHPEGK